MTKPQLKDVLLSSNIVPQHYTIFLQPDLDNFVFEGNEEIKVNVKKPVNAITLHSAELEILSAKFQKGKIEETAKDISYDAASETVTLTFAKKVPVGIVALKLLFSGVLNNKMRGFYRSKYTLKGKTYHMGVTQFESTDARRAFPCFDEPALKATFDVSLKVPEDRAVISNTLEEEVVGQEDGYKVVKFERSPKMSTYLLAFIVGHFEYIETKTKEGVKVRVYVTPGKKKQAEFALEVTSKIMSFYDKYFGIAYPLPTMDLIAIPDFANGAMENWGAVTYRETALLVDAENSSLHTKQWVALIIAHELAHQWFGNLVTMKWWTHLWLNEGFASFMEYLAVDKLFPEWRIWTQFVYNEQAKALSLDGLENTHAIEIPVSHPGEISEIFDAVSYSKGASVIRMIESYIGEENFQKGLQYYLQKHKYSNAQTQDLWDALQKVSGQPVGKIMQNWTSKPGYPLITSSIEDGKLSLTQERFYSSALAKKTDSTLWLVPINIATGKNKKIAKQLIDKKTVVVDINGNSSWLKLNADDSSFVRIKYPKEALELLEEPIRTRDSRMTEEGRFALVRDSYALAKAGYSSFDEVLSFIQFYKLETSYIVWAEITSQLFTLKSLLFGEEIYDEYCHFAKDILLHIEKEVGWKKKKNESHEETLLRSTVLFALGSFEDKEVVRHAKELFEQTLSGKKIDSDLRSLVYVLTAENGGKKQFAKFMEIYKNAEAEEEKDRALRALCSFKERKLLEEVLTITFSTDVRSQDAFKATYLMASNPYGTDIIWEYVKEHWEEIVERFAGGHLFARFISPFAKFKTFAKAEEVETFFKKNMEQGIERTVAQTVEEIYSNADLVRRELKKIEFFLKK